MKWKKMIPAVVFILYCGLMLWLLFGRSGYVDGVPYMEQMKYNLWPFETIRLFWRQLVDPVSPATYRQAIVNLFGNVIMFIPLGLFLPLLFMKKPRLWKTLLWTAGIITLVEVVQLFTLLGSCDTDDLILNVLGAAIGYSLYRLCHKKKGNVQ